jgi:hypothetical protein
MKTKTRRYLIIILPLALILTGCLTSELPFYQDGDIVTDDRLLGSYQADNDQTSWHIAKSTEKTNGYVVTLISDVRQCPMRFSGVLFQVGTNRFLDLFPLLDACDHVLGGPPSPIEVLQAIMIQPLHLAIKIDLGTNSLRFAALREERQLELARAKAPGIWNAKGSRLVAGMLPNTKAQRQFLETFGNDTNIFVWSVPLNKGERKSGLRF